MFTPREIDILLKSVVIVMIVAIVGTWKNQLHSDRYDLTELDSGALGRSLGVMGGI
jgi:hypothetical protein